MSELNKLIIRPSALLKYEQCPQAYKLSYIDHLRSKGEPVNLAFGTVIHAILNSIVTDQAVGSFNDMSVYTSQFIEMWRYRLKKNEVMFKKNMLSEDVEAMGVGLIARFPEAWKASELVPAIDASGFMLERRFNVPVPGIENVVLSVQPDIVAMDQNGNIVLPDFKTAATPSSEWFAHASEQLTLYQYAFESKYSESDMPRVSKLGFFELIKRKIPKTKRGKGPEIAPFHPVSARTPQEIEEVLDKVRWMAEDIRRNRLPRRPQMAWNSPCSMCDHLPHCFGEKCQKEDIINWF